MGVPDASAHTFTVTVPPALTYPQGIMPSPGYVFGETLTVMLEIAPVMDTAPLAHCPAVSAEPPTLPVVPDSVPGTLKTVPLFSHFFHVCAVESAHTKSWLAAHVGAVVSTAR